MKKIIILLFICSNTINTNAQTPFIQWEKSLGGGMYDYAKEVELTSDGGQITVGYSGSADGDISSSHGNGDCWIVKSSGSGAIQWSKAYGGTGLDYGYSIKQTSDGGYIVAGYSESNNGDVSGNHGGGDCWILKLNASGTIQWQKTFGGTLTDKAQCIRQTTDGGYIVCAYAESSDGNVTASHGGGDCWILKLNASGSIQWEKTLGGTAYDFGEDIKETSDGGYVLTGGTDSNDGDVTGQHGNGDCWIVKLNSTGSIVWQNSFGGTAYDYAQSVEQTTDGGYVLAGYSESSDGNVTGSHGGGDCWVVKCDELGNLQWEKALGSSGNDYGFCIQQIIGGAYILTGYSELNDGDVTGNHGGYDCWVLKLSGSGTLEMQRSFGGTGMDIGYSIRQKTDGSFIITGYSGSEDGDVTGSHGNGDCWVIKLNFSSLDVADNTTLNTLIVFPNPSSGNFNISGLTDQSSIEIYDISGKLIFGAETRDNNFNIDLSDRAKGIYFCKEKMKNGAIRTNKIIVD